MACDNCGFRAKYDRNPESILGVQMARKLVLWMGKVHVFSAQ
jgi:hypothetical protein